MKLTQVNSRHSFILDKKLTIISLVGVIMVLIGLIISGKKFEDKKKGNYKTMKVLLVNGSPRKNGETNHSLKVIENVLHQFEIETEWFQLGTDMVRGCCGCNQCQKNYRCRFTDDKCNELIEQFLNSDGIIIGSPVYFAGPNGALCALLDRVFYI